MKNLFLSITAACAAVSTVAAQEAEPAAQQKKSEFPTYERVPGIAGNLNSIGSDTLNNLMALWTEAFQKQYPNVKIQVEGKGSSTAPPALISGTAQLGPMSRAMKPTEIDDFEKEFGYKPTQVPVAIDALEVYVHRDNPLESLTLPEVDAIFSKGRKGGHPEDITTWGQVGLTGPGADQPIRLYGRNSASGTYGYFKDVALFKGDYKDTVKEQPGSAAVVRAVTTDRYGIGYSGIGYKTSGVKTLDLAKAKGEKPYSTADENVYAGKYPLSRFLYVYVNKAPNEELGPLVREFMRFVLSKQGQKIVEDGGYLPLTPQIVMKQREELQ